MAQLTRDKKLLIYLSEVGIGQYREINSFLEEEFPKPNLQSEYIDLLKIVRQFIYTLANHEFIQIDFDPEKATKEFLINGYFVYPIKAMILKEGMEYISKGQMHSPFVVNVGDKNKQFTIGQNLANNRITDGSTFVKSKSDTPSKVKKWVGVIVAVLLGTIAIWTAVKKNLDTTDKNVANKLKEDSASAAGLRSKSDSILALKLLPPAEKHNTRVNSSNLKRLADNEYSQAIPLTDENIYEIMKLIPRKSTPVQVIYTDPDSALAKHVASLFTKKGYKTKKAYLVTTHESTTDNFFIYQYKPYPGEREFALYVNYSY